LKLEQQVVAITGGGSGIGRATALLFAKEGARVAIIDHDLSEAEETSSLVRKIGLMSARLARLIAMQQIF
jgi:NAD(P)-dependent dehydrogenase (short-subunit alcohol dehydrogenase family)